MGDPAKRFATPEEEISHWRSTAEDYKIRLEETREELEEFQISSRELELELETQLEQAENKNKEFNASNQRLQMEVENLQQKLEELQQTSHRREAELEDELATVVAFKNELQKYIRELEQSNDDLERAKRATITSLEDFEARLNMAIERNAFLESELEEKDQLHETVQRLKDEARDLRQEIHVTHKPLTKSPSLTEKMDTVTPSDVKVIDSNRLTEKETIPSPRTPLRGPALSSMTGQGGTPLTPSARISALNIVGDLLRKVGALESKLASCRNFVKDQPRGGNMIGSSPVNSPRAKRLNRGASTPSGGQGGQAGLVKITV